MPRLAMAAALPSERFGRPRAPQNHGESLCVSGPVPGNLPLRGVRMNNFFQNLRFAVRQLRRNPGFTFTVIVTLALAIGANTAIFSLVNALLLKSLPYPHPERMGTIFMSIQGAHADVEPHWIDGAQWEALRDNVPSMISAVSSSATLGVNLEAGNQVQYVHQGRISAHYLDVLFARPMLGRNFSEVEDQPHGANAAILSYA